MVASSQRVDRGADKTARSAGCALAGAQAKLLYCSITYTVPITRKVIRVLLHENCDANDRVIVPDWSRHSCVSFVTTGFSASLFLLLPEPRARLKPSMKTIRYSGVADAPPPSGLVAPIPSTRMRLNTLLASHVSYRDGYGALFQQVLKTFFIEGVSLQHDSARKNSTTRVCSAVPNGINQNLRVEGRPSRNAIFPP